MNDRLPRWRAEHGFTLLEALVVVGFIMVGFAVVIPVTQRMVVNARGDSALAMTNSLLESARNRAVAERRNVELVFIPPNRLQVVRLEVPSGARTTVGDILLEGNSEFLKIAGLPDTPEASGFSGAITFTGAQPVMFTSDGSLIDSSGDVTNGTVFLARPGERDSARAITISGVTGLVRQWKWRGESWEQ